MKLDSNIIIYFVSCTLVELHFISNNIHLIYRTKTQVPFSMTTENGELVHECCPEHLRMEQ